MANTPEATSGDGHQVIIDNLTYEAVQMAEDFDLIGTLMETPLVVTQMELNLDLLPEDVARAFALSVLRDPYGNNENAPSPFDFSDTDLRIKDAVDLFATTDEQWNILEAQPLYLLLKFAPDLKSINTYGLLLVRIQSHPTAPDDVSGMYILYRPEDLFKKDSELGPICCVVVWGNDGSAADYYRPTGNLGGGAENEWKKFYLRDPLDLPNTPVSLPV